MADLNRQIAISVDASGVETGVGRAKRSLADLGASAATAGKQASSGLAGAGDGASGAATKVERATANMIASIQRQAAAFSTVGQSAAARQAALADLRGVDVSQLKPFLDQLEAAEVKSKAFAAATKDAANAATFSGESIKLLGKSAAATGQQHQIAAVQVKDFFEQVVSGGSPLRAFAQQGAAVVSTYGGLGATFTGLASLVSPVVVGVSAVAAAIGAVVFAAYQGSEQTKAFNKSLLLTGNYAGQTADGFNATAAAIAKFSTGTIGQSREVLQALISTGKFGTESLQSIGAAAITLQTVTGQSSEDVVKQFAKMRDGVSAFASDANKQYNYLTAAQFKYIQTLEAEGKSEQAYRVNADLLNNALRARSPQLSGIEKALKDGKNAWSEWWDAAFHGGRGETVGDVLDQAKARLEDARRGIADLPSIGPYGGPRVSGLDRYNAASENVRLLNRSIGAQQQSSEDTAENAKKNQKEIFEASATFQGQMTALQSAGLQMRLAQQQAAAEQEQSYLDKSYSEAKVTLAGYAQAKLYIGTQELKAQQTLIDAQIALEKKAVIAGSPEEVESGKIAQQQRILDLQKQAIPVQTALFKLQEQYRKGELLPGTLIDREAPSPSDAARKVDAAQREALEQSLTDRKEASIQAATELLESTRSLNVSLIRDDRQRGQAQIDIDLEVLRKRLDTAALSESEQARVAGNLADYRVAREHELTEQLKPAYAKQLDSWRDTTKLFKGVTDELGNGLLGKSEDAFAEFARTGKLNFKSLIDFTIEEMARFTFRAAAAKLVGDSSSGGFNLLGLIGTAASAFGGTSATASVASALPGDSLDNFISLSNGFPKRAAGGPVAGGETYWVGEKGPELLRMGSQSGSIVPNHALGAGPNTWTVINQTSGRFDKVTEVQISPTQRALIIQEAAMQGANLAASHLYDPNSRMSQAMKKNVKSERVR